MVPEQFQRPECANTVHRGIRARERASFLGYTGSPGWESSHLLSVQEDHTHASLPQFSILPPRRQQDVRVSPLITRAARVCSDSNALKYELGTIRRELIANGYPKRCIRETKNKILQPRTYRTFGARAAAPTSQDWPKHCRAFFFFPQKYDWRITHVPTSKLRNRLMNVEGRLTSDSFPGVVYKIPCADCRQLYIGETEFFTTTQGAPTWCEEW